jgi:hypothetical protein
VWYDQSARGIGEILSCTPQTVPQEYHTRAVFRSPLRAQKQIRIAPVPKIA